MGRSGEVSVAWSAAQTVLVAARLQRRAGNTPNLTTTIRAVPSGVTISTDGVATNAQFGGEWSMLTLVDFPSTGCWEIRGTYQGRSLAFVAAIEP